MVTSAILTMVAVVTFADDDTTFAALLQRVSGTNTSSSRQQTFESSAPENQANASSLSPGGDDVPPHLQGLVLYEGSPFDGRSGERAKLLPPIATENMAGNSPEPVAIAQNFHIAETVADIPVMSDIVPSREMITPQVPVFTEPLVPPTNDDTVIASQAEMQTVAESFNARSIVPEESVLKVAAKESVAATVPKVTVPENRPVTKSEEGLQSPWGTAIILLFLPLLVLLFLTGAGRLLSSTMRLNAPQPYTRSETEQHDYRNKAA